MAKNLSYAYWRRQKRQALTTAQGMLLGLLLALLIWVAVTLLAYLFWPAYTDYRGIDARPADTYSVMI